MWFNVFNIFSALSREVYQDSMILNFRLVRCPRAMEFRRATLPLSQNMLLLASPVFNNAWQCTGFFLVLAGFLYVVCLCACCLDAFVRWLVYKCLQRPTKLGKWEGQTATPWWACCNENKCQRRSRKNMSDMDELVVFCLGYLGPFRSLWILLGLLGSLEVCLSPSMFMCDSMCSLMQSTERACDFCAGCGRRPRTTRWCCGAMDNSQNVTESIAVMRSHKEWALCTSHCKQLNTQRMELPIFCAAFRVWNIYECPWERTPELATIQGLNQWACRYHREFEAMPRYATASGGTVGGSKKLTSLLTDTMCARQKHIYVFWGR